MSGMTDVDGWMRDVADAAASLDKRGDRQMSARLMRLHRDMDVARLRGDGEQGQAMAWIKPDWSDPKNFDGKSPVTTYPQLGWTPLYIHPQPVAVPDAVRALLAEWRGYKGSIYVDNSIKQDTLADCADELEVALSTQPVPSEQVADHEMGPDTHGCDHAITCGFCRAERSMAASVAVPEVGVDIPWPPLPKCWTGTAVTVEWQEGGSTTREVYTDEQMRVYAQACHEAMLAAAPVAPVHNNKSEE